MVERDVVCRKRPEFPPNKCLKRKIRYCILALAQRQTERERERVDLIVEEGKWSGGTDPQSSRRWPSASSSIDGISSRVRVRIQNTHVFLKVTMTIHTQLAPSERGSEAARERGRGRALRHPDPAKGDERTNDAHERGQCRLR